MLDHLSLPVADLDRAAAFYDAVLATLGLVRRKQRLGAIGYGPPARPAPVFWILQRAEAGAAAPGIGLHASFQAPDRASVDLFHATALRRGGRDAGGPGVRPEYTAPFYGAFVLDLDGFKIEAVCRTAAPGAADVAPLLRKVDCHSLRVADLEAGLAFYRDRLGHELKWRTAEMAGLRLPDSDAELVLHAEERPQETDFLVADVDAAVRRFVAAGGTVLAGPFDIRIGRCAAVTDPWGNVLVLLDMSKGPLRTDADGNVV